MSQKITMRFGNAEVAGTLNDTAPARAFAAKACTSACGDFACGCISG